MNILTIIGTSAIFSSIISIIITNYFERRRQKDIALDKINEERYRNLLYHMNIILNHDNIKFMNHLDPETGKQLTHEGHIQLVKAELDLSVLYASKAVIVSLKHFIKEPGREQFFEVAKNMRKSLWKDKNNLTYNDVNYQL